MVSLVQSLARVLFPVASPLSLEDRIAALERKLDTLSSETVYKEWRILECEAERQDPKYPYLQKRLRQIRSQLAPFEPVRIYGPLVLDAHSTARGAITGLGDAAKDLAQKSPQGKLQVKVTAPTINIALTEVFHQLSAVYNAGPWLQFLRTVNVYQIEAGKLKPIRLEDDAASDALNGLRDQMAAAIKLVQDAEDNLLAWEFTVDTELRGAQTFEGQWEKRHPLLSSSIEAEGRVVNYLAEKRTAFHTRASKYIEAQQGREQRKALHEIYVDFESGTYTLLCFGFLKK